MSEIPTEKISNFEQCVLAEFAWVRAAIAGLDTRLSALEDRLTALGDRVDARLKETRPIWEAVQTDIKRLDTKFDNVIRDLYDLRTDVRLHDKRLNMLET